MAQAESSLRIDNVCESIHSQFSLTSLQIQECKKYPELVSLLMNDVIEVFQHQCYHQFKYERWDCKNISPPIIGATQPFLTLQTKEAAFVHALASAAVVHTVAQLCAKNKFRYCGCDKTVNNKTLPTGAKWAGCSADIDFSIRFAEMFVDQRVDNATLQYQKFVLHNNNIGRLAVKNYMQKTCICYGSNTKRCTHILRCHMTLPTMVEVAAKLKKLYRQSSQTVIISSSTQQHVLVVERKNHQKIHPGTMIYFNRSPNYCVADPDYNITGTGGRECTLTNMSFSHHCDSLCCDRGYVSFTYTAKKPCRCKFIWCCEVKCDVCYETKIRHRCINQPNIESDVSSAGYDRLPINFIN